MEQTEQFQIAVNNLYKFLEKYKCCQLKTIAEIYDILVLCANLTSDYDESHNMQHHIEVYKTAIEILIKDFEQKMTLSDFSYVFSNVTYACLLHDTIDHKYPNNLEHKKKRLEEFLPVKLPNTWVDVKWIIDNISYSKESKNGYPTQPNELLQICRDVVSDADKIQALGDIGWERCRQFTIEQNPKDISEEEIIRLVIAHSHDKLLKLKDSYIRTATGKELAQVGHDIILGNIQKFH